MDNIVEGAAEQIEKLGAMGHISSVVIVIVLVAIGIFIFTKPIRFLLKAALNTVFGFVALIVVNWVGSFIGIAIGINWINAIVVAILGIPGVALLFILQWLMLI